MRERFFAAPTFEQFLSGAERKRELWHAVARRARAPEELVERARALGGRWHLLALTEDWCGDAIDPLPYVARLADAVPGIELRVLSRDENLDIMDEHLTDGARAIPIVIVYDEDFRDVGFWGPRPRPLQAWTVEAVENGVPSGDRHRELRRWYGRDRGRTTLEEILDLMEVPVERT